MKDETENSPNERKRKPLTLPELIADMDRRFTSLNGIPVSRASVRPEEWALLRSRLSFGATAK